MRSPCWVATGKEHGRTRRLAVQPPPRFDCCVAPLLQTRPPCRSTCCRTCRRRLDGAARRLLTAGDQRPSLESAFAAMCQSATAELRANDRAFAELLATWSASEPVLDDSIVPVEHLLDRVVAPVAMAVPVIVLVCDGLAVPVANGLLEDIAAEGWTPAAPAEIAQWPVGLAMPTVTEVSRASLLSGSRGKAARPRKRGKGFSEHAGLKTASSGVRRRCCSTRRSSSGRPVPHCRPRCATRFWTSTNVSSASWSTPSTTTRVARPGARRLAAESLGPLPWVLDAAAEAGRVVMMTADHGHVLHDASSKMRQKLGGGEGSARWAVTWKTTRSRCAAHVC